MPETAKNSQKQVKLLNFSGPQWTHRKKGEKGKNSKIPRILLNNSRI
jgi:hypothetical protein